MDRLNRYGPSVVLLLVGLAALYVGPHMIRSLAYAEQEGRLTQAREQLKSTPLVDLNESFRNVARAVEPSVVHISVKRKAQSSQNNPLRRFFQDPFSEGDPSGRRDPRGQDYYNRYNVPREVGNGSGWVYEHKNGNKFIITNYHVVEDADELVVKFFDKTTARARVVGTDPQTDIAVLDVPDSKQLHSAKLSDKVVERGDIVFAFGSPLQFEFSMSQGIVSADGRKLGLVNQYDDRGRIVAGGYENFIQTDAAINPGNSGGPLANIHGDLVGMNSAIASLSGGSSGLGFAIPVEMIREIADQLIEKGEVQRGYLGVYLKDMDTKMSRSFGYNGKGVLVRELVNTPNGNPGPAEKAGIKSEDIVTHVNGKPTATVDDLRLIVASIPPGQAAKVTVFREGKTLEFSVKVAELPSVASRPNGGQNPAQTPEPGIDPKDLFRKLGIERLSTLTKEFADRVGIPFTPGVLVESVRPQSVAATEGLKRGMVVTHVQGTEVSTVEELAKLLNQADLQEGVRLRVKAGDESDFILLSLPE